MIPAHENTSTQSLSTNQNIYPGHRILILLVGFSRNLHKFIQRRKLNALHVNEGIDDRLQAKLGPQDNAREAQATDSSAEKLIILVGRTNETLSIRAQQFKTRDVAAERASLVMILAMHIVSDSPTHRDELGTRRNRDKPAVRYNQLKYFCQRNPCFAA